MIGWNKEKNEEDMKIFSDFGLTWTIVAETSETKDLLRSKSTSNINVATEMQKDAIEDENEINLDNEHNVDGNDPNVQSGPNVDDDNIYEGNEKDQ